MADRTLTVKLVGDAASLQRSMRQAETSALTMGAAMKGGAAKGLLLMRTAALGAGVAVGYALVKGLKGSFEAAVEAEASQAKLHAQLKALGQDTPAIAGKVNKMADSLSMLTGFDDEALTDAFSNLARNVGDSGKALTQMGLVTDIARAKNMSLEQASTLVSKVMNGNTGVLKRYGIVLGEHATKQEALAALQSKFGGQAEAYGKTTAGSMAKASVAMQNLQETIGLKLAPAVAWLATGAVALLNRFGPEVGRILGIAVSWVEKNWPKVKAVVMAVVNALAPIVRPALEAVKQIMLAVGALIQGRWGDAWDHIKGAAKNAMTAVREFFASQISALGAIAERIGSAIMHGIQSGLSGLGSWLVGKVKAAVNSVLGIFNSLAIPSVRVSFDTHIPGVGVQGFSTPRVELPNIPLLANGGIVNRPTLAMIGEAGPEAVVPLGRGGGFGNIIFHQTPANADPQAIAAAIGWARRTVSTA